MQISVLRALLLSDDGRANRTTFWLFLAGCLVLAIALLSLPIISLPAAPPIVISILLIFPTYCMLAKRLQDLNVAGQWAIFIVGIAAIDAILIASGPGTRGFAMFETIRALWWWIALANMLGFFAIGLLPGTKGLNRYGPEPI